MSIIEPDAPLYAQGHPLQQSAVVEPRSSISARVGIHWQGQDCDFYDWSYLPSINLWRDYLPAQIEALLPGLAAGDEIRHSFRAGELLERQSSLLHQNIPLSKFQPPPTGLTLLQPAIGRYYPSHFYKNVPAIYEGYQLPCRIIDIQGEQLSVDFNHPLSNKSLEMVVQIESIRKAGAERGGRCNDVVAVCCDQGPGMQDSLPDQPTDFWAGNPFSRQDSTNDSVFFSTPSLQPYWDRTSLAELSRLYDRLIPKQSEILDLMAGVHSPVQESAVSPAAVICAGLNSVELEHNPLCTQTLTLDVNSISALPFEDARFDVVLIHAAIEYVINPQWLMTEIQRVLKPSGRIIISFSNRSITEKAIQLWSGAHEFERPAIVLDYLRSCPGFARFNSFSLRGLLRPEDDPLAHKLIYSDPLYVVWADKI